MTQEDFNELMSTINNATSKEEVEALQLTVVGGLTALLSSQSGDIAQLAKLLNPATFIVEFIKMIKKSMDDKIEEKNTLTQQKTELDQAIIDKINSF